MTKDHGNNPSCPFCLIGFFNQGSLRKPIEDYHKENIQIVREFQCTQCNFTISQQSGLHNHMMNEHGNQTSCPFCLIRFYNQETLKKHIENCHNENTQVFRESARPGRRQSTRKGPCIFHLQPRGCKKGVNCDFSHEKGSQYSSIKVPKLCLNGPRCNWKPRCRYLHPEDGEIIPPRSQRVEARAAREEVGGQQHQEQVFVSQQSSQPPPGNTMNNFPPLGRPGVASIFKMNPQSSALNQ